MKQSELNNLIKKVVELESAFEASSFSSMQFEKNIYDIIKPLFENDGYSITYQHRFGNQGIDFIASNNKETIGIEYKHRKAPVSPEAVRALIGSAVSNSFERMMLLTSSSFSKQSYELVKKIDPIKIELLPLIEIKNWISRIEVDKDISKLDVEEIIKVVSDRFIELISKNPDDLDKIEWRDLERIVAELFEGIGFNVTLTPPSKDGGKDVILECVNKGSAKSYIVEIKHWRSLQKLVKNLLKIF